MCQINNTRKVAILVDDCIALQKAEIKEGHVDFLTLNRCIIYLHFFDFSLLKCYTVVYEYRYFSSIINLAHYIIVIR